jgi:MFS family permease
MFFQTTKTRQYPIWDVMLFYTNKVFTFSCLASLIIYTSTFMNVVLLSLYLQYLQGMSATAAGVIMMVQPLTMAVFSPLMGKLSDRLEPRVLASAGMSVTAVGLIMLGFLDASSATNTIVVALIVTGLGFSLFSSPNVNAIMGSVQKKNVGSASVAVSTTRTLGQMSSMVLVTLVMAVTLGSVQIEPSVYPSLEQAISLSFFIAAVLCVPGLYLSASRGRLHSQD